MPRRPAFSASLNYFADIQMRCLRVLKLHIAGPQIRFSTVPSTVKPRKIYSRLLRRSTAKGSSTGLVPVGPNKVLPCKSILFTGGTPEVEINRLNYTIKVMVK